MNSTKNMVEVARKKGPKLSMKLMVWNYRGLGGPFIISQLKESQILYLPDIIFISETKQNKGFVSIVCRKLKVKDRWDVVESRGKSGEMMIFWEEHVKLHEVIKSDFYIEAEVEGVGLEGKC